MSRGIPEPFMKKVDEYVDSLAPHIQPRIADELETFQNKTIDSLEEHVVSAFRQLFDRDGSGKKDAGGSSRSLSDSAPDAYGGQSLPFADELAKLTKGFSKITDEAGDDLRDIFNLTDGGGGGGDTRSRGGGGNEELSRGANLAKGFFSAAVNAAKDHLDDRKGSSSVGQKFELDGLLGVLSNTVKDAARNPEEKARLITPEIREKVGVKLRSQHMSIAETFTKIALDRIKKWLRGNTSSRDLADGAKGEIEDQVKGLVKGIGSMFGKDKKSDSGSTSRGFGDAERSRDGGDGEKESSGGGFSKVVSEKMSVGLAKVHREVRIEFRTILGKIEKELFELLPDQIQGPLEKILGGNPFDSQLDKDTARGGADRGFADDVKSKLLNKIRSLVRKVQETIRESILGVVNGGHRKLERESWGFVHRTVEGKVQKYLPKVQISVPDDIGNEGVSVGDVSSGSAQVGGHGGGGGSGSSGGHGGGYSTSSNSSNQYQQSQSQSQRPDHRPPQGQQQNYSSHQQYSSGSGSANDFYQSSPGSYGR